MVTGFRIERLDADDERPEFSSPDDELNEFYHELSTEYCKELLAVTYVLYHNDDVVAFYCVSNDALRTEDVPTRSGLKRILQYLPHRKRGIKSHPAVKIGRLSVADGLTGQDIGTTLLDRIKFDFTHKNKTGCRFIIVDAYNNPRTLNFYQKNGFIFVSKDDEKEDTRIMLFDLILFLNLEAAEA